MCTGAGKCSKDFEVNSKGWYTYKGMLVLAGPTIYGQYYTKYEGRKYFKYYDTVQITIDGVTYPGIILDTCGACSFITHENRLDIFVETHITPEEQAAMARGDDVKLSNPDKNVIDRGYKGRNLVHVSW